METPYWVTFWWGLASRLVQLVVKDQVRIIPKKLGYYI